MKSILLSIGFCLLVGYASAQAVSPAGVYAASGNGSAGSVSLDWSIGGLSFSSTVNPPNPGGQLALVAPVYNCSTGAFTFNTSGGNGSLIEYMAIGISGWTTNPNQFVDNELRTAADAPLITLRARQTGIEVTYVWNLRAHCQQPSGDLQLIAPIYNCQSGSFTFQTTGGNGSPIEFYAVPGITGWTSNPNQSVDYELRTAADAQPITLRARQNGVEVTYVWNIRAVCPVGNPRKGVAEEPGSTLSASLYPNPVNDELGVTLAGASDKSVLLELTDLSGHIFIKRTATIKAPQHQERFQLSNLPGGMYLLRINAAGQWPIVLKVIKQ